MSQARVTYRCEDDIPPPLRSPILERGVPGSGKSSYQKTISTVRTGYKAYLNFFIFTLVRWLGPRCARPPDAPPGLDIALENRLAAVGDWDDRKDGRDTAAAFAFVRGMLFVAIAVA